MPTKPKPRKKTPTDGFGNPCLTRRDVANMIGVTKAIIVRLHSRGELQGIIQDGIHYYTRAAVEATISRRSTGNAVCFQAFEEGKGPVDVVLEMDLAPERVGELHRQWHKLKNRLAIDSPHAELQWEAVYKIRLAALTPAQLLRCIEMVHADPALRAQMD